MTIEELIRTNLDGIGDLLIEGDKEYGSSNWLFYRDILRQCIENWGIEQVETYKVSARGQGITQMSIEEIAELCTRYFGIDICEKCKRRANVQARTAFYQICRDNSHNLAEIGRYVNKTHSDVISGLKCKESTLPEYVVKLEGLRLYIKSTEEQ